MKFSRSVRVWAVLVLCGMIVLAAMAWLTRDVIASEQRRAMAEARADLEERTRLALWRMDTVGAAILLGENQRAPSEFAQPISTPADTFVTLRFQVKNGKLDSPGLDTSAAKLQSLRAILTQDGDIDSLINRATAASEKAWQSIPKDVPELRSKLAASNAGNSLSKRSDQSYQLDSNQIEKVQRARAVERQESSSAEMKQSLARSAAPLAEAVADIKADEGMSLPSEGEILQISSMRPVWIEAELFLIRKVTVQSAGGAPPIIQGVWLDAAKVKAYLLKETTDLLPGASLEKLATSANDPLALVSFPFRLQQNVTAAFRVVPLSKPLIVGWIAVFVALLTISLLVHGVMVLSERRASFVSAVTHELRTPLTTFRLYSDMLESGAVKEEKRSDYLRVLSREADRLSHLVENVLSFSKIERGSARSVVREVSLIDLLEPLRERLESRLATAGLTLTMNLDQPFAETVVRVDIAAIEHILFNLIDNAAKYAAVGEPPQVEIGFDTIPNGVKISVSDHGPGIPVSERRRIFRSFHKSAREAAESRPGVGLGLALSRRLAKSLGGGLDCVDSPNGARFVLRLPVA